MEGVALLASYNESLDFSTSFCSFIVFGFRVHVWVCLVPGKGPKLTIFPLDLGHRSWKLLEEHVAPTRGQIPELYRMDFVSLAWAELSAMRICRTGTLDSTRREVNPDNPDRPLPLISPVALS